MAEKRPEQRIDKRKRGTPNAIGVPRLAIDIECDNGPVTERTQEYPTRAARVPI
jgi:hypothetical protein